MSHKPLVLSLVALGLAWIAGDCVAGSSTAPVYTWLVVEQSGRTREAVPPLVFWVDAAAKTQADRHGGADSPFASPVTAEEMASAAEVLGGAATPPAEGREFRVRLGAGEREVVVRLAEADLRKRLEQVKTNLRAPDAIKALKSFGEVFGWQD